MCLACHSKQGNGHAYDLRYSQSSGRFGTALRPVVEVARRGLLLPDGQIRCVTCHSGTSPWNFRIRLPMGAAPNADGLARPWTYEARRRALPRPKTGDAIGLKPLCLGRHVLE